MRCRTTRHAYGHVWVPNGSGIHAFFIATPILGRAAFMRERAFGASTFRSQASAERERVDLGPRLKELDLVLAIADNTALPDHLVEPRLGNRAKTA
jgi:hypothetical protein